MTDKTYCKDKFEQRRTLYVTDMDGTLLDLHSRVSRESAEILSRLSREGALITVATARTPATVVPLMAECGTTVPYVTMTGAALWNPQSGEYTEVTLMSDATARTVRHVIESHGLHPFIYTIAEDRHLLAAYHNGPMKDAEHAFVDARAMLPLKRFYINNPEGERESLPRTILYFTMGDFADTSAAADELRRLGCCAVSSYVDTTIPGMGLLEVFAPGIDKGAVVKQLAAQLGATRIVAFGDNLNDLPLLRVADVPVAVANALPEVKSVATHVIGANDTNAVARFIAEDFSREN
jgi:hypothetical protein